MPLREPLQRNKSLQEQAYQALKTAILLGELAPGQRLVETALAKKLQVSRTPIREAIRLLQHENLATIESDGVMRVATIAIADAVQLYDCRIALEELSVKGACQNATKSQLDELESMVKQAEKLAESGGVFTDGVPPSDPHLFKTVNSKPSQLTSFRLLDIDYRFHRLLAQSSGNFWLVTLLDQVFDKMQLLRIQTTKNNPNVLEIRSEHRQIYQPVRDRNPEAAVMAIKAHLYASKERVIREVQQLQQNEVAQ